MVRVEAGGIPSRGALGRAPSTTSVILCEVSTLPAAIAAGSRAFTTVPSGAITRIGRRMPDVNGTPSRIRQRNTYITPATLTPYLAFTDPSPSPPLPVTPPP